MSQVNDPNYLLQALTYRIEEHTENKNTVQRAIDELATELTSLKITLSKELEEKYISENTRLQTAADYLKGAATATEGEALMRAMQVLSLLGSRTRSHRIPQTAKTHTD